MTEDLIKLKKYGIEKVGYWKLVESKGYSENRHNNSISFYFNKQREKCNTNLRCLYVFVSGGKVIYVGKTNQGLSKRMSSYSSTSNQLNVSSKHKKNLSDRHKVNKIIEILKKDEEVFIYSFFDDKQVFYKDLKLNLISGLEDPLISIFQPKLNEDSREKTHTKQLDLILNEVRIKKYDSCLKESGDETFSDFLRKCIDEFTFQESHKKIKHFSFSYTEVHKKRKIHITPEQENKLYTIGKQLKLNGKGQVGCFIMDRKTNSTYDEMKHLDKGEYHTSKKYPKRIVVPIEKEFYNQLKSRLVDYELSFVGQIIRYLIQNKIENKDENLTKIIKKEFSVEERKSKINIKRTTFQMTDEQFNYFEKMKSKYNLSIPSLVYSLVEELK